MEIEVCRNDLQTVLNTAIAKWRNHYRTQKPWVLDRQLDIVLTRIVNRIREVDNE